MKIDKITMPSERNGRYFLYKREGDQEQYIIYMRESLDGKDRVLVDPHLIDPDNNTSVGISSISKDGTLLAYSLRQGGEDEVEIHFLNVDTKDELDDILPKGRYFGISIKPDKSGIFYSSFDDNGPRVTMLSALKFQMTF
ncbi:MAG: S9 family peptidase, partial [Candidatus Zixiibacteriota bacterium]